VALGLCRTRYVYRIMISILCIACQAWLVYDEVVA
jgi:hypothetical protein